MPKVSIVMPVYGGEAYLREALDSIIQQTLTDWELIAVNECGSSEAATRILEEYAARDSRIRVIQNRERLYIAESLNVGLRAATGEYIARMDADDISGEKRLETQAAFLDEHPQIDVCGLKVTMFGSNTWDWKVYSEPEYLRCACLFYTPCIHPTIMMRAARLRQFGLEYDPDYHYTEDYEFFARATEHLRFTNLREEDLYYYRFLPDNATNVGGEKGIQLQNQVMEKVFSKYGLAFTKEQIAMLSPNSYPAASSAEEALEKLEELDLLLKKILLCDAVREDFGIGRLFEVLHRRWMSAYEKYRWTEAVMADGRVKAAVERGLFHHRRFSWKRPVPGASEQAPRVSIVVPSYNSEDYILDTVFSLLDQDYTDFELLIVNELGSDDQTVKCVRFFDDRRVRVIQNEKRLGLAESLNRGIREARGELIARADADDVYPRDRLSKQVAFMDSHPDVAVCGTWQRHFGKRDSIHMPPASPEEMKASLLFKCDVCHSTVMLRKAEFVERDLWYDKTYLSEDYELWTRAAAQLKFATIPEVLGEYRWTGDNITAKKLASLDVEAQKLLARSLRVNLGIEVPEEDMILLSGWQNPFLYGDGDREALKAREEELLEDIERQNGKTHAYDPKALAEALDVRRSWASIPVREPPKAPQENKPTPAAPKGKKPPKKKNPLKEAVKRVLKPIYRPFRRRYEERLIRIEKAQRRHGKRLKDLQSGIWDIDGHLYDYYYTLDKAQTEQRTQLEEMRGAVSSLAAAMRESQRQMDDRVGKAEENLSKQMDARIWKAEENLSKQMDGRVWKAEENLSKQMDGRVWKAEENLSKQMDARVWKAEENLSKQMDARVWKAEENLSKQMDARVWKAEESLSRQMDARVWKAEQSILHLQKNTLQMQAASVLASEQAKRIFLIGTPEHNNIGDAAIVVGEVEFIRRYFPDFRLIEVPDDDMDIWYETVRSQIRPGDMIFLQGGGNMGSRYLREETVRRRVVGDFRDCRVVILPQTAFYDDSEEGRKELAYTASIFARHPDLTILARGEQSLRLMREYFPGTASACIPDMALLLERDYGLERKGVLPCIRALNDESGLDDARYEAVMAAIRQIDPQAENTDNLYQGGFEGRIWQDMRRGVVDEQLRRFASHRVVVTDRLHGVIFALITHTPCVALSSYNYKIGEFCRTFVRSDRVFFLDDDLTQLADSIRKAMELGPMEDTGVDLDLFDQARRMIQEGAK